MPIHIPSKYHHFILGDTAYRMKYLIPKTLLLPIRSPLKQQIQKIYANYKHSSYYIFILVIGLSEMYLVIYHDIVEKVQGDIKLN